MAVNYLYKDQQDALYKVLETVFNQNEKIEFTLSGVAGSGKSTVISELINILIHQTSSEFTFSVCAPTNRAAAALAEKIKENNGSKIPVNTIHSHLYEYRQFEKTDENGEKYYELIKYKRNRDEVMKSFGNLLIVDESSMINKEMINMIRETGVKVIFVGDRYQLPPVKEKESILSESDFSLEKIYRTDHQDIMNLSTMVRSFGRFFPKRFNDSNEVFFENIDNIDSEYFKKNPFKDCFDVVVCGTHKVRKGMNDLIRDNLGYREKLPMVGEKVIAKDNNLDRNGKRISNGDIFTVISKLGERNYELEDVFGYTYNVPITEDNFIPRMKNDEKNIDPRFDFAYAITCHNAQGSTFNRVLFMDENVGFFLPRDKFRYTAITRAAESITIATSIV